MAVRVFLKNDNAVEGMPMRIMVTVVIFAVILGLVGKAASDFIGDVKEKKLMDEVDRIEKRASLMYAAGGGRDLNNPEDFSGTVESIRVKIPDNAAYVVFGRMPDGAADERTDNVYYYVLNNGRVQAKSSIARFSHVMFYPGEYELTLELIRNNSGTYVAIRSV